MATDSLADRVDEAVGAAVDAAFAELKAAEEEPYYDEAADQSARESYYQGLDAADGEAMRAGLASLLERTHTQRPSYKPMEMVYPRVDRHPDGLLRSIYSGRTFTPAELIRSDAEIERRRTERMLEFNLSETAPGPRELEAEAAAIEETLPYNCEHVVCQSWFEHHEPMRGDLHHLFTCEANCNSFRGNFKYVDFPDFEKAEREDCGKREETGFEPWREKATVARATLYFMLRYPALGVYSEEALAMLLKWHETAAVSDYERHRNAAIFEKQGNRNPLIDHPEWALRIGFSAGL